MTARGLSPKGSDRGNGNMDRGKDGHGRRLGQGGFLLRAHSIPTIQIRSEVIREKIELLKEKSLIGKFVGVWPKEKDLVRWI